MHTIILYYIIMIFSNNTIKCGNDLHVEFMLYYAQ